MKRLIRNFSLIVMMNLTLSLGPAVANEMALIDRPQIPSATAGGNKAQIQQQYKDAAKNARDNRNAPRQINNYWGYPGYGGSGYGGYGSYDGYYAPSPYNNNSPYYDSYYLPPPQDIMPGATRANETYKANQQRPPQW